MNQQLICSWLGLPPASWPPDHYQLLGLPPGEPDTRTIEHQVHERLETVRRYQLIHPEPATEAMNRLAQAFVCLTDPQSKKAYDATLLGDPTSRSIHSIQPTVLGADPTEVTQIVLPIPMQPIPADGDTQIQSAQPEAPTSTEPALRPAEPAEPPDPLVETARSSPSARRGLGTKRALYHRIARTRQLLRVWESVGKYVGDPSKRVSKPAEATELIQDLTTVRVLLRTFPPFLGAAGQPGYLVMALARLQAIVPTFQTLLPSQRDALARDWKAGQKLLIAHRGFLRQELRSMRRRGLLAQVYRAVKTVLTDQPGMVLLLLALLALNVAVWRYRLSTSATQALDQKPPTNASK